MRIVVHIPSFSFLSGKDLFGECHFFVLAVEEIFFSADFCQAILDFFFDAVEVDLAAGGVHLFRCEDEVIDYVATDIDAVLRS